MTSKKAMDLLNQILRNSRVCNGFERTLGDVQVTGGDGRCVAEFMVKKEHLNNGGALHNGCIATIMDTLTTCMQAAKESPPGNTVGLHIRYFKPAKEGDTILIDAQAMKAGESFAYLECKLRDKATGMLIAKGTHTRFVGAPETD